MDPPVQSISTSRPYPLVERRTLRDVSSLGELEDPALNGATPRAAPNAPMTDAPPIDGPDEHDADPQETDASARGDGPRFDPSSVDRPSGTTTPPQSQGATSQDKTPKQSVPRALRPAAGKGTLDSVAASFYPSTSTPPTPSAIDPIPTDDAARLVQLETTVASMAAQMLALQDEVALLRGLVLQTAGHSTAHHSPQPQHLTSSAMSVAHSNTSIMSFNNGQQGLFGYGANGSIGDGRDRDAYSSEREREREASESPLLTLRSPSPDRNGYGQRSNIGSGIGGPKAYLNLPSSTGSPHIVSPSFSTASFAPHASPYERERPGSASSSQTPFNTSGMNTSPSLGSISPNIGSLIDGWKRDIISGAGGVSPAPVLPAMGLGVGVTNSRLQQQQRERELGGNGSGIGMMRSLSGSGLPRTGGGSGMSRSVGGNFGAVGSVASSIPRSESFGENTWDTVSVNSVPSPSVGLGSNSLNVSSPTVGSLGGKWEVLGVGAELFRCIVKYGLGPPTKIQSKAIPCVLQNQDIVAQAPSIQERIQCYVIPAVQLVASSFDSTSPSSIKPRGVQVVIVTATVDQAAQAQRLSTGLGNSLGVKTSLCVGNASSSQEIKGELVELINNPPHLLVGTPLKLLELFKINASISQSGPRLSLDGIKLLIIDECDQLIARNLSEYLSGIVRFLPSSNSLATLTMSHSSPNLSRSPRLNATGQLSGAFDYPARSAFDNAPSNVPSERQTAIFSCTVPQDVLNFAAGLNLREPVRVLVRREGVALQPTSAMQQSQTAPSSGMGNDRGAGLGMSTHFNPEPTAHALRSLKHYFVYLALGGAKGTGRAEGRRAAEERREWKLEALADFLEDYEFSQAVVFCGSVEAVEAVSYKIASRSIESLALHQDMGQGARHAIMSKFRSSPAIGNGSRAFGVPGGHAGAGKKCLVVYDALTRTLDLTSIPLVVNYDLPRSVEDYIPRIACVTTPPGSYINRSQAVGVVVNIVTPGTDVDILRSIETFYRVKISELPPLFPTTSQT